MPEKEYLLGNKAKELLIYTNQVTKPVSDKDVDAKAVLEFARQMSKIQSQEERLVYINAVIQRLEKRKSGQGFPKSSLHTYIKDLRETALRIIKNVHSANECLFETEHQRRLGLIKAVLDDCNLMLKLIEISYDLGYINLKRCEHWTKLVTNVKYMSASWKKKDGERAKKLTETQRQSELRWQANVFAQILREAIKQN